MANLPMSGVISLALSLRHSARQDHSTYDGYAEFVTCMFVTDSARIADRCYAVHDMAWGYSLPIWSSLYTLNATSRACAASPANSPTHLQQHLQRQKLATSQVLWQTRMWMRTETDLGC